LATGSAEAEMRSGNWGFDLGFFGDRKFDTERTRGGTVVGAAATAEVDDANKPERSQSRIIEPTTMINVSHTHRHVIQHGKFPLSQLQRSLLEDRPTLAIPTLTTDHVHSDRRDTHPDVWLVYVRNGSKSRSRPKSA